MTKKLLSRVSPLVVAAMPFMAQAQWSTGKTKAQSSDLPSGSVTDTIVNLMKWLLIVLGAIAIIGFVVSGILYLTSAGDEERMEKAKRGMIYSIIGVIVGLIGYIVVIAISNWLGGAKEF